MLTLTGNILWSSFSKSNFSNLQIKFQYWKDSMTAYIKPQSPLHMGLRCQYLLQHCRNSHIVLLEFILTKQNKPPPLYSLSYFQFSVGLANILQLHQFKLFIDSNRLYKHFGYIAWWPRISQINRELLIIHFKDALSRAINTTNYFLLQCSLKAFIFPFMR